MKRFLMGVLCVCAAACSDEESDEFVGYPDCTSVCQGGEDAAEPDVGVDGARPFDAALQSDAASQPDSAVADAGPACETTCFSNRDCAEGTRCVNTAAPGDPEVACCLPGERGDRVAGESCADGDGQILCASAVCVEGDDGAFCSAPCDTEVDCPANMQRCFPIGFDGGRDPEAWCFPG